MNATQISGTASSDFYLCARNDSNTPQLSPEWWTLMYVRIYSASNMQLTVEPVQTQMLVTASTNVQPCMMGHICIGALSSQCEFIHQTWMMWLACSVTYIWLNGRSEEIVNRIRMHAVWHEFMEFGRVFEGCSLWQRKAPNTYGMHALDIWKMKHGCCTCRNSNFGVGDTFYTKPSNLY